VFHEYCDDIGISVWYVSMAHPRSNDQVEWANTEMLKGLKTQSYKCLKNSGKGWVDELPAVLPSNRTTPNKGTTETPFFQVYGAEAVLPPKVAKGSPRVVIYDEAAQD
jgi:hypothetical protein